ncbi:hypothetical protein LPAF129_07390 [Ligilactobacillus pabuli]|uniref:DUF2178 domain-containing protein n=1 Tax=Ligilactobacillus pabuli TaxID=2886039 RepID=A0ABQ5JG61_9LACO|nr:hypothetical protein [Ligilactobacillus pabuli]GKS81054.1 hypothetical protein LPAF129_07390 [Ligilactobacillus pabuli]
MNVLWQAGLLLTVVFVVEKWYAWALIIILLSVAIIFFETTFMSKKYHVTPTKASDVLYFAKDERDQQIALKVHSAILATLTNLIMLAFILLIFSLITHFSLTTKIFWSIGWLSLAFFIPNIQYYILWNKYDAD